MTGGRYPLSGTRRFVVVLLAVQLMAVQLLVAAGNPRPALAGLSIQTFPWGQPPSGWIAFAGSGIVAAPRECSDFNCIYRLTDNPWDTDPAWDPTGRRVFFETRTCEDCRPSIGWVDTETGAVSRPDDEPEEGLFTPAPGYDGVSVAVSVGQPGPCATGRIPTPGTALTASFGEGRDGASGRIGYAAMLGTGACAARPQIGLVSLAGVVMDVEARLLSESEGSRDTCGSNFASREAPRWSPISDELAYIRRDGCGVRVFVASSTNINGTERHVPTPLDWMSGGIPPDSSLPPPGPTGVDWSPDGSKLVVSGQGQDGECGHYVVPIAGGAPAPLFDFVLAAPCGYKTHPRWAPDDDLIAVGRTLVKPDGSDWPCVDDGLPCFLPPLGGTGGGSLTNFQSASGTAYDPQCTPGTCLTLILVSKVAKDLSANHGPTTFTFTAAHPAGTSSASLIVVEDPFALTAPVATLRVKAGEVTIREAPVAGWKPYAIECARPGARVDVAAGSVTLTVPDASTTKCTFTNDPGDLVLPGSSPGRPTPSPSAGPCLLQRLASTEWWAGAYAGRDTMQLRAQVPWCLIGGKAVIQGDVHVDTSIGTFFGSIFTPFYFRVVDGSTHAFDHQQGKQLIVDIETQFEVCTSPAIIISQIVGPLKIAAIGFRALPASVRAQILRGIVDQVDTWIIAVLERAVRPVAASEQAAVARWMRDWWREPFEEFKDLLELVLLDPQAEKLLESPNDTLLLGLAGIDMCVVTWRAELEMIIDDSGRLISRMRPGSDAAPVWEIREMGL